MLYENMRTFVLEPQGYGRGRYRVHPGFLDFAATAVSPAAMRAASAQTKGKAERFIRYRYLRLGVAAKSLT